MYKGQMYTVTFDHKPTQKEAMQTMADELDKVQGKQKSMDFAGAATQYIESKRNILSPSTIRGYDTIVRNTSESFLKENIYDITAMDVQREINLLARNHSPKSVRNHHGFISAVLGAFNPSLKLTLFRKRSRMSRIYHPVMILSAYLTARGTKYEIPIILACYGMRRSEICALTPDDVDDDVVTINKAMVQSEEGTWVIKTTKTTASSRDIVIPETVAEKIAEQGYVYKGNPNSITCYLARIQTALEIPKFSIHKLRHYFASQMSAIGIPDACIMRMGGWETDHVMKSVYRHSMMERDEAAKRDASEKLRRTLFS